MMAPRARDNSTIDLFSEWRPPDVAVKFEDGTVRAIDAAQRISRAVSVTLREAEGSREDIAAAMSEYLGEAVTDNMLNAYASPAREGHNISLARAFALLHATGDARIFGTELERFGLAIIPVKFLAAVEEAMWSEQEERARQKRMAARSRWKAP